MILYLECEYEYEQEPDFIVNLIAGLLFLLRTKLT
jgi:hypothetical protein